MSGLRDFLRCARCLWAVRLLVQSLGMLFMAVQVWDIGRCFEMMCVRATH